MEMELFMYPYLSLCVSMTFSKLDFIPNCELVHDVGDGIITLFSNVAHFRGNKDVHILPVNFQIKCWGEHKECVYKYERGRHNENRSTELE